MTEVNLTSSRGLAQPEESKKHHALDEAELSFFVLKKQKKVLNKLVYINHGGYLFTKS